MERNLEVNPERFSGGGGEGTENACGNDVNVKYFRRFRFFPFFFSSTLVVGRHAGLYTIKTSKNLV